MNKVMRRLAITGATAVAAAGTLIAGSPAAFADTQVIPLASGTPDWHCGDSATSSSVHLVFQCDGNLVLYRNSDGHAMWASGTDGAGATGVNFSARGKVYIYRGWQTQCTIVQDVVGGWAAVQDDGNFVVYRADGSAAWDSGTSGDRQGTLDQCG